MTTPITQVVAQAPVAAPTVQGHLFDGSEFGAAMFHRVMLDATSGNARNLLTVLPALMQDQNFDTINWGYQPPAGDIHHGKTSLFFLTLAAKNNQDWAKEILSKLLTKDATMTGLNWNTASASGPTEGLTPFMIVMISAMEQQPWAIEALTKLLNNVPFTEFNWNAKAVTGEAQGRTPLFFLAQMCLNNANNLAVLERVQQEVENLDFTATAEAGIYAGKSVNDLYAQALSNRLNAAAPAPVAAPAAEPVQRRTFTFMIEITRARAPALAPRVPAPTTDATAAHKPA